MRNENLKMLLNDTFEDYNPQKFGYLTRRKRKRGGAEGEATKGGKGEKKRREGKFGLAGGRGERRE